MIIATGSCLFGKITEQRVNDAENVCIRRGEVLGRDGNGAAKVQTRRYDRHSTGGMRRSQRRVSPACE